MYCDNNTQQGHGRCKTIFCSISCKGLQGRICTYQNTICGGDEPFIVDDDDFTRVSVND